MAAPSQGPDAKPSDEERPESARADWQQAGNQGGKRDHAEPQTPECEPVESETRQRADDRNPHARVGQKASAAPSRAPAAKTMTTTTRSAKDLGIMF